MTQAVFKIVAPRKLDVPEIDALFEHIVGLGAATRGRECLLDLSGLEFMTPAGLTGVVQGVLALKKQRWSPSVQFPENESVASYLVRMGLKRAVRGKAKCLHAPRARRYALSNALVELTTITNTEDVEDLLSGLAERVAEILEQQLEYRGSDVANFVNVISELSRNIIDHSGAVGCVAAQRYTRRTDGRRYALISVGDVGAGLRETLGDRFDVENWTDAQVLIRALLPKYSRHPDRGLGLAFVKKISVDYQGSLHIRSGGCRVYIRGNRATPIPGIQFPGTQIAISLSQKPS